LISHRSLQKTAYAFLHDALGAEDRGWMKSYLNDRDIDYSDYDFRMLSELLAARTGISLAPHKAPLLYSRLAPRLRALSLHSFSDYYDIVRLPSGEQELSNMVNALTTNLTHFFREAHHFDILRHYIQNWKKSPARRNSAGRAKLRIWSAGCSTGEEVYSIAMTVHDVLGSFDGYDIKILGTDIDSQVLQSAFNGIYKNEQKPSIPDMYQHYLDYNDPETFHINDAISSVLSFGQLNLIDPWPVKGPFDVIFCRNVVIYFARHTQQDIFNRMYGLMTDNSLLFIGHSENLFTVSDNYRMVGRTVYSLKSPSLQEQLA
jgi:chemotaxis protein methyltransferase CheR